MTTETAADRATWQSLLSGGRLNLINSASYLVWLVLAVMSLYYLLSWVGQYRFIAINQVRVEAANRGELKMVKIDEQALGEVVKGHFFNVNLGAVASYAITLPWVEKAEVWRVFPNRIKIFITEHKVLGYWGENLLSPEGQLFSLPASEKRKLPTDLPRFSGDAGHALEVAAFYRQWQPLFRNLKWSIAAIELSPRQSWEITIKQPGEDAQTVKLALGRAGYAPTIEDRLTRLLSALPSLFARFPKLGYIDLRYAGGVALR